MGTEQWQNPTQQEGSRGHAEARLELSELQQHFTYTVRNFSNQRFLINCFLRKRAWRLGSCSFQETLTFKHF